MQGFKVCYEVDSNEGFRKGVVIDSILSIHPDLKVAVTKYVIQREDNWIDIVDPGQVFKVVHDANTVRIKGSVPDWWLDASLKTAKERNV